ncbi:hypothetical protein G5714_023854 [Onychostoma macrolepis]|uniref:LRAT domain-containing protein n=1 Tax=Onychostoma macrolepis TaxID=369639 RepID=A0A7J6BIL2_9TELE|nr:hypothetical protein G5714_023854 [Onychostoma macrolepis]
MKFVLIAVLLQLCLSVLEVNAGGKPVGASATGSVGEEVNESQLQFGDLLVSLYEDINHYAVYVGGEVLEGKSPNQNIFEMTAGGCRFHKVHGPFRRHNYLDPGIAKGKSMPPQSREDMIRTIQELRQKDVCQKYSLLKGNCEQIATKVRYGEARCKQEGTNAASLAKFLPNPKLKRHDASAAA